MSKAPYFSDETKRAMREAFDQQTERLKMQPIMSQRVGKMGKRRVTIEELEVILQGENDSVPIDLRQRGCPNCATLRARLAERDLDATVTAQVLHDEAKAHNVTRARLEAADGVRDRYLRALILGARRFWWRIEEMEPEPESVRWLVKEWLAEAVAHRDGEE